MGPWPSSMAGVLSPLMRRLASGVDFTGLREALGRDMGVGREERVAECDVSHTRGESAGVDMVGGTFTECDERQRRRANYKSNRIGCRIMKCRGVVAYESRGGRPETNGSVGCSKKRAIMT